MKEIWRIKVAIIQDVEFQHAAPLGLIRSIVMWMYRKEGLRTTYSGMY